VAGNEWNERHARMNVGKPVGRMKSTESDVGYFEVNAVFNGEPVELLEESM